MFADKTIALSRWTLLVGVGFLLVIGGLIGRFFPHNHNEKVFTIIRDQNESGLVHPLIGFDTSPDPAPEFNLLRKKIESVVDRIVAEKKAKTIGVYVRDLDSGNWTGVNENEPFAPGSLLKVPLMMTYLKAAERNPGLLEEKIYYAGGQDLNILEYFHPTTSIKKGTTYTVEQLLNTMVVRSGNNSTYLLHEYMDKNFLQEVYTDLGINAPENYQADFLSPKAYSLPFRTLYNATFINAQLSQKGIDMLVGSTFKRGLKNAPPQGIIVANKYGESSVPNETGGGVTLELHDCGIIYFPNHPTFICIMTKGTNFEELANVIGTVAGEIYASITF